MVCGHNDVLDIHWHVLSDCGCDDERVAEARELLWQAAEAATDHPTTHMLLQNARRSLVLEDGEPVSAPEMSEGDSLGLRLILGGWMSKAELDDEPWWPHEIKRCRRDGTRLGDAAMLQTASDREADRRALTRVGQAWMRAVDDIVATCI